MESCKNHALVVVVPSEAAVAERSFPDCLVAAPHYPIADAALAVSAHLAQLMRVPDRAEPPRVGALLSSASGLFGIDHTRKFEGARRIRAWMKRLIDFQRPAELQLKLERVRKE